MLIAAMDINQSLPKDFSGTYTAYRVTNLAFRKSNDIKDIENAPANEEDDEKFRTLFFKYAYYYREHLYDDLITSINNEVFFVRDDNAKKKEIFFNYFLYMRMKYHRIHNLGIRCDINSPFVRSYLDATYYFDNDERELNGYVKKIIEQNPNNPEVLTQEFIEKQLQFGRKVNEMCFESWFSENRTTDRSCDDEWFINQLLRRIYVIQAGAVYVVYIDDFLMNCMEQAGFYTEKVDKSHLKDTMIYCRETGNHLMFNVGDPLTDYYIHHYLMNERDKEEGYEWSLDEYLKKSEDEDRGSQYSEYEPDWTPNYVFIESPAVHYSEILKQQQEGKENATST